MNILCFTIQFLFSTNTMFTLKSSFFHCIVSYDNRVVVTIMTGYNVDYLLFVIQPINLGHMHAYI